MIHKRVYRNKYSKLDTNTLIDIILDREDTIKQLESKLKHIKQYFDDIDEIYIKDVKDEINRIMEVI